MTPKFFTFFILSYFLISACSSAPPKKACEEKCKTKFGTCIGQSYQTKAYSNCNEKCVKHEMNFVFLENTNRELISGMKWQCVEYARRWLIENKNVTFADVQYAYSIWDLKSGERVDTNEEVPLFQFENNISKTPPQVGDLLIYSSKIAITGHVAIVAGVDDTSITIAEQNHSNDFWEGDNYSRRLLTEVDEEGRYRISDNALIGWVRFVL